MGRQLIPKHAAIFVSISDDVAKKVKAVSSSRGQSQAECVRTLILEDLESREAMKMISLQEIKNYALQKMRDREKPALKDSTSVQRY